MPQSNWILTRLSVKPITSSWFSQCENDEFNTGNERNCPYIESVRPQRDLYAASQARQRLQTLSFRSFSHSWFSPGLALSRPVFHRQDRHKAPMKTLVLPNEQRLKRIRPAQARRGNGHRCRCEGRANVNCYKNVLGKGQWTPLSLIWSLSLLLWNTQV